jgi:hypothetical protein
MLTDKTSKEKTLNGTKCQKVQNVDWKKLKILKMRLRQNIEK